MYDFQNRCFLCDKVINKHNLKRRKVHTVTQSQTKDYFLGLLSSQRDDIKRKTILKRFENVTDISVLNAKYHKSCMSSLALKFGPGKRGKRNLDEINAAMEDIYQYIDENFDECQFPINQLLQQVTGPYVPHAKTVKKKLLERYGNEILIFDNTGIGSIACYRNIGRKLLTPAWYKSVNIDPIIERNRVVVEAAGIILEDIKSKVYKTNSYPSTDKFLDDSEEQIPESLGLFLNHLIKSKKRGDIKHWNVVSTSIAHLIISAVRPRSFVSPVKLGVGAYLHKTYGSRLVIDLLSSLGFSCTYNELLNFESSCALHDQPIVSPDAFLQFVFDNADFNVNTIDGHDTFHAMGGIECITPQSAVAEDRPIQRCSTRLSAQEVGSFGQIPIESYNNFRGRSLENLPVLDLQKIHPISREILPPACDVLWLYAKWSCDTSENRVPNWNGFMDEITSKNKEFERSRIRFFPFINSPPSQHDTILTALLYALQKMKATCQKTCFVTFDQPLFIKASEIVYNSPTDSDLRSVVVRLGGFHLLMSFMGAIGYIMGGSGLEDLFGTVYAPNSVVQMMTGHAYSRAYRAHSLVHLALGKILFDSFDWSDEDRIALDELIMTTEKSGIFASAQQSTQLQKFIRSFGAEIQKVAEIGPTAKFWIQYYQMVSLIKRFVEAERSGNWELHKETVQRMLPFFHAAGRNNYSKSAHLYLQNMAFLQNKMTPSEFEMFTGRGYFTIRRSDKFWSGIWSDMTIEQTLMREMKTIGGLTHGRSVSDSVTVKWTLGKLRMHNIIEQIENFSGVYQVSTEQHIEMRTSRMTRDNIDGEKICNWLAAHPPFARRDTLISLASGVVADDRINCHNAAAIGEELLAKFTLQTFGASTKRSSKVKNLDVLTSSIIVEDESIAIDPMLLFRRICVAKKSNEDLKRFFQYELSPFPMSLFDNGAMRKNTKSDLYKAFAGSSFENVDDRAAFVLDGGFLLHKVQWDKDTNIKVICEKYITFLRSNFKQRLIIIFDGYPENVEDRSTKSVERKRRNRRHGAIEIEVNTNTVPKISQEQFLSTDKNKVKLIQILRQELAWAGYEHYQAFEDADSFIVQKALEIEKDHSSVYIVGEDVDLIILLTSLAPPITNVKLLKPMKKNQPWTVFAPSSFKFDVSIKSNLLFLHAVTGCDTTSAIFNAGKMKAISVLEKKPTLSKILEVFKEPNQALEIIKEAGERFLVELYGGESSSLDELRFILFQKSLKKVKFNLACLPPTSEAAQYHSYRVYHQVQQWLDKDSVATERGWKKTEDGPSPILMCKAPGPEELLKIISCRCTKGCGSACGCRKAGLKCSILCFVCNGSSCTNAPQIETYVEEEDGDIDQSCFEQTDNASCSEQILSATIPKRIKKK